MAKTKNVTLEDLAAMVARGFDDLEKNIATKDDLAEIRKEMATKVDVDGLRDEMSARFVRLAVELGKLESGRASKNSAAERH